MNNYWLDKLKEATISVKENTITIIADGDYRREFNRKDSYTIQRNSEEFSDANDRDKTNVSRAWCCTFRYTRYFNSRTTIFLNKLKEYNPIEIDHLSKEVDYV